MDVVALILFLVVIIIAFVKKMNVGVLALAVGVIAVRIFGMTDKDLIAGISTSMFATLTGITLLFAIINTTGALDLLARKIVAAAGKHMAIIPIAIYAAGFIVAGIGPGAVPALAIIPALAVSIAVEVGYNPVMLAIIGECGLMGGRMTPITPEAAIIESAAESAGLFGVMPTVLICQTFTTVALSIVIYIIFKGYKVKEPKNALSLKDLSKFNSKQIIALLGIVAMLVLLIGFNVNIALVAFLVSAVLVLLGVGDDGVSIMKLPWATICMVLGVGALLDIVNKAGGIDLLSNALFSIMNKTTAIPLMGVAAGLLSLVSSALGVVYPTMMPMSVDIAAQFAGSINPVAMMGAVGVGGSLAGLSPLSTGGALILAALATNDPTFNREKRDKVFVQLFGYAAIGLVVIMITSALGFNFIANTVFGVA